MIDQSTVISVQRQLDETEQTIDTSFTFPCKVQDKQDSENIK